MLTLKIIATVFLGLSVCSRLVKYRFLDWVDVIVFIIQHGAWRAFVIVVLWLL